MEFTINNTLLAHAKVMLAERKQLYWIVGGSGSGKTTICNALSTRLDIPVYDMDAHIYGSYHGRFSPTRHPVNSAWAAAENGLAWLLDLSWEEFNRFNQAALPEYLELLVEDLAATDPDSPLLIDGGICNPALVAHVISPRQLVGLARPERSSVEVWEENADRRVMKEMIYQLPEPEKAWQKFLYSDNQLTHTILTECQESSIAICSRNETEAVVDFADRVAIALAIG